MDNYTHRIKRENYDIALARIESGAWTVDAESGTIYSRRINRQLRGRLGTNGYLRVTVYPSPGNARQISLHRVIWESVHGPIAPGLEVNHKDLDKANNRIKNLELVTHQGNCDHALRNGHWGDVRGTRNGHAKLTESDVRSIRELASQGELFLREIAEMYNTTVTNVSSIKQGYSWTWYRSDDPEQFIEHEHTEGIRP